MNAKTQFKEINTPFLIRLGLWMTIWLHVISGAVTLIVIFPFANAKKKEKHIQGWSKRLLEIFGIKLVVNNANVLPNYSFLLSSNHISWMDIHAINAFKPIRFVAKSEVKNWPLFGWMAGQLGTVFIRRDSSKHAHIVVSEMGKLLESEPICIFPEGTSTNGENVKPFKPNLFESAVMARVPVCSLAIRYISMKTGTWTDIPAFVGDMGLLQSMSRILQSRNLAVELTFFPPVASGVEDLDRKFLALNSYNQIDGFLKAENS